MYNLGNNSAGNQTSENYNQQEGQDDLICR